MRQAIVRSLSASERHRYFGSMRSSQALAQSVFGSLAAVGKADALAGLTDDDGLLTVRSGVRVQLEHLVRHLGEPSPTSVSGSATGNRCREAEYAACPYNPTTSSNPMAPSGP